jgi:hypothetical protein
MRERRVCSQLPWEWWMRICDLEGLDGQMDHLDACEGFSVWLDSIFNFLMMVGTTNCKFTN